MNEKILIRPYQTNDVESLTTLTNALGYPTTIEQMANRMETISRLDYYWTYVAELDNNLVGYIGINKNLFWETDGEYLKVQALVVDENYRQLSIGRKLVEAAELLAKELNIKWLFLNCGNREERTAAHLFYQKIGFTPKSTGYAKTLD